MKYTLITGASSGIGEEFARRLAAKQNNLILVARSEDKLKSMAAELENQHKVNVEIIPIDLSTNDSAEKVFEHCQARNLEVDYLINNAGLGLIGKFDDSKVHKIEEMLILNVLTLTKLTYFFLPQLKANRGKIINLGSFLSFVSTPNLAAYAATKAYVLSFSEAIKVEYKNEGIKILAVCPGTIYTNFYEKAHVNYKDIHSKFRSPEEVVDAALKALEKNKSYVTAGWDNKLGIFLLRFLPRSLAANIAGRL